MVYDFNTVWERSESNSSKWSKILNDMGQDATDVLPLSIADMEFKAAPEIMGALHKSVEAGIYGYCAPRKPYYDAVRGWMHKRHNWEIANDWIITTPGVVTAVFAAVNAFTQEGDGVLVQTPAYPPFISSVVRNGRLMVDNPLVEHENSYIINFESLEAGLAEPTTKMMILCSPHNPTGRVWSCQELEKIADLCWKHSVLLVADEIHNDLIYPQYHHTVLASISPQLQDSVITLTAPTKTFNLAGLQCSNIIIANCELREKFLKALQDMGHNGSHLNFFGAPACEAAYNFGEPWLTELLLYIQENKTMVSDFLAKKLPKARLMDSQGTYLLWVDFRGYGFSQEELEHRMREIGRVYLDEGYIFGEAGVGFERINIACPRAFLEKAMNGIKRAINA